MSELHEGNVYVDGIKLSTLGLHEVRGQKISIIPQDPVLFSGTIRTNVDPFNEVTDEEIYTALEKVSLGLHIINDLNMQITDGGKNW